MKFRRTLVSIALGAALAALPLGSAVQATPGPGTATDKYVDGQGAQFESLAGSKQNLTSLASGLRTGSKITLVEQTRTGPRVTKFTPATGHMGYGNVTRSLDLAGRELASLGINDPTATQLKAALNGGTVTTARGDVVRLDGVLQLRSQGMGWGKIAHTIGVPPSSHANAKAPPHVQPHAAASAATGHTRNPGVVNAAGAARSAPSSRGTESARSGIVTAAGGVSPGAASGARGHGNAFGAANTPSGAGIHTAMGPGGGGHANGRAGK